MITSITTQTDAELIIHFIGETESNKLKVNIVGININERDKMLSIAPNPTAIPPKQPITKMTKLIKPNLLNSDPL